MLSFCFGKYLFEANKAYKSGDYANAYSIIEKALLIKKFDFKANLLRIRITIMLSEYLKAISLINQYKTFKNSSKLIELLIPWEEICLNKINQTNKNIDLIDLNNKTDNLLEQYEHSRPFKLADVLIAILLFIGTIALVTWSHINLSKTSMHCTFMSIYTFIILFYYYNKAIIKNDIYTLIWYIKDRTLKLFHSKIFLNCCLFITLGGLFYVIRKPLNTINQLEFSYLVAFNLAYPISEEIFIRGILYTSLLKYGERFSWLAVTVMFVALHGNEANLWHIILSVCCLITYVEEKTILAPIFIHIINNTIASLFYPKIF